MPGPGFFSSPERPTAAYNAARYIPPGSVDAGTSQLHPPRPGFIATIGSPVPSAQTLPGAAIANKAGLFFSQIIELVIYTRNSPSSNYLCSPDTRVCCFQID